MGDGMPFIPARFDEMNLNPFQFRIVAHIARRGDCYSSTRTMAQVCRMGRTTLIKELKSLVDLGVITTRRDGASKQFYRVHSSAFTGPDVNHFGPDVNHQQGGASGPDMNRTGPDMNHGGSDVNRFGSPREHKGTTPFKVLPKGTVKKKRTPPKKRTSKKPSKSAWDQVWDLDWPKGFKERKDFVLMFQQWVEFRVSMKKLTQSPGVFFGRQLAKMQAWGVDGAIESISASLESEWRGLFPPKRNGKPVNGYHRAKTAADEWSGGDFEA